MPVSQRMTLALFLAGSPVPKRSVIYVDGFNFYYGLLRSPQFSGCKWLDLGRLFSRIRQADDIQRIKYFTGYWPDSSGKRHAVYTKALSVDPKIQVVLGNFKAKTLKCRVPECSFAGNRTYRSHEEKQTDVNIALHMLDDAYQGVCDIMVLVTADSDLVPAIDLVKSRVPRMEVVVYIPGPHSRYQTAVELRSSADRTRLLPGNLLRHCLLPDRVVLPGGSFVERPKTW